MKFLGFKVKYSILLLKKGLMLLRISRNGMQRLKTENVKFVPLAYLADAWLIHSSFCEWNGMRVFDSM